MQQIIREVWILKFHIIYFNCKSSNRAFKKPCKLPHLIPHFKKKRLNSTGGGGSWYGYHYSYYY